MNLGKPVNNATFAVNRVIKLNRNQTTFVLMLHETKFNFRNKEYLCSSYIDSSVYPCLVFVVLADPFLIREFGEEITVKTDGEQLLAKKDDYPQLMLLRVALLDAIKKMKAFAPVHQKMVKLQLLHALSEVRYQKIINAVSTQPPISFPENIVHQN